MKRRIMTVVLAVLLAVLGTTGVLAYVRQADARALAGQKAVTVLVAGSLIPAGTSAGTALRDGLLTSQRLPADSVPADAVSSLGPELSSLVTSADIQSGQLLLRPMLVTAAQETGALAIPKGMVAVTIALCVSESVGGYVQAGSEVAVFDTYGSGTGGQDCGGSHAQPSNMHTRIVLPRVEVLAVGSASANAQATSGQAGVTSATQSGSAQAASGAVLVTLAVDQADAERLITINESGLPYLALLTSSSHTTFDPAPPQLFRP